MSSTETETLVESNEAHTPTPLLDALKRDGFVHIPSLISESQISTLRTASSHITSQARQGKWPYIRTVPKQFPPWPSEPPPASEGGIWGCQHLLHPAMPGREEFAKLYFSDEVLDPVKELIGIKDDEDSDTKVVMELFNLLVSPTEKDFELRWHRDDVKPDVAPDEELRQLQAKSPGGKQAHAQYNIALYSDYSLVVVPGSHRRARTDAERKADPYESEMPGQVVVPMRPGDAVFYDSNIFHRGVYKGIHAGEEGRLTLHGCVGLAEAGSERARQVLQHGVGQWVGRDDAGFQLEGKVGKRAEEMRKRLIAMGTGENVGYSLEG